MMGNTVMTPDYLFEVSWEVCNKIGGIHTVLTTKAPSVLEKMQDKYILIGPDVWRESGEHPEFIEDNEHFRDWSIQAADEGLIIRTGRWRTEGEPYVILVDFTTFFGRKDEIFKKFWELYKLDSITGQWDYIEPMLFGYATGKIIESFLGFYGLKNKHVVAQFHEWMTAAGLLYLKETLPQVGTVFTTHATVVGRALASAGEPLYSKLESFNGDEKAAELGVVAKQSVEMIAAHQADVLTTVSEITAAETARFLNKPVDMITPNGIKESFFPSGDVLKERRMLARKRLIEVASLLSRETFDDDVVLLGTSGRYEFRNKGLDLFIDALGKLNRQLKPEQRAIAYIVVPANHYGPRKDLKLALTDGSARMDEERILTHYLHYAEHDQIMSRIRENNLNNAASDPVKVVFIPSYLNGRDGIIDLSYYDVLSGFDLSVFPSYYDSWGYSPLESLACRVPTLTTSLTGFGRWVGQLDIDTQKAVTILERDDRNDEAVVDGITEAVVKFFETGREQSEQIMKKACMVCRTVLWENMIKDYWEAYALALGRSVEFKIEYTDKERVVQLPSARKMLTDVVPVWRRVVIQQQIPAGLKFLEELSRNLWWSWNPEAVNLFRSVDSGLWEKVQENPILLLEKVSYERLSLLENDKEFKDRMQQVRTVYDEYMHTPRRENEPSVSYFSMEFGLHNSLKIYSGGLGLLAGDYLKEASDYNYDMVGVGLLYRYGYFRQEITAGGTQVAHQDFQDFSRIPVVPVKDENGNWKTTQVVLPGRPIHVRIWKAQVGRVPLYLLDADFEANKPADRQVTYELYGGDHENRFKQELLLGIGGVRALRELGIHTDLYHLNEGHAAFTGFERLREYIQEHNMTLPEAREIVRATSLFTTHTPVPAGHDKFDENMMRTYLSHYPGRLTIDWNRLMNLGRENNDDMSEQFSMSVLAVNLSQEVNGVSKLHGQVSREMFAGMWKGHMVDEIQIGHVTNGVHLSTWLSDRWRSLYMQVFGSDFLEKQEDRQLWNRIHDVEDERIWKIRNDERSDLTGYIRQRLSTASVNHLEDPAMAMEIAEKLDEKALTIGFARRFATYKRANLLFTDLDRLASIVNHADRPIQFVFAGKAHPKDKPGQDLIRRIIEISRDPEFTGKIIFLQNYDIHLAKKLLHGVDIWLNTPTRPLEASGTSGEKAVMNGGLHFSVLDGWWAEGYREGAGWALPMERTYENQAQQDELDAERIYSMLEHEIAPKFYARNDRDIPVEWVKIIKNSISGVAPEFTMNRMLRDYIDRYYRKLYERSGKLRKNDYRLTREISYFKKQIMDQWKEIKVLELAFPGNGETELVVGQEYTGKIRLDLNGLPSENIGVEMVKMEASEEANAKRITERYELECKKQEGSVAEYSFRQYSGNAGQFDIGFRIFPKIDDLPHRMDLPLVRWI